MADHADFRYPRDADAEVKGSGEEMVQVTVGMAQHTFVGSLDMGGIEHQSGFARHGQCHGIAGSNG